MCDTCRSLAVGLAVVRGVRGAFPLRPPLHGRPRSKLADVTYGLTRTDVLRNERSIAAAARRFKCAVRCREDLTPRPQHMVVPYLGQLPIHLATEVALISASVAIVRKKSFPRPPSKRYEHKTAALAVHAYARLDEPFRRGKLSPSQNHLLASPMKFFSKSVRVQGCLGQLHKTSGRCKLRSSSCWPMAWLLVVADAQKLRSWLALFQP